MLKYSMSTPHIWKGVQNWVPISSQHTIPLNTSQHKLRFCVGRCWEVLRGVGRCSEVLGGIREPVLDPFHVSTFRNKKKSSLLKTLETRVPRENLLENPGEPLWELSENLREHLVNPWRTERELDCIDSRDARSKRYPKTRERLNTSQFEKTVHGPKIFLKECYEIW